MMAAAKTTMLASVFMSFLRLDRTMASPRLVTLSRLAGHACPAADARRQLYGVRLLEQSVQTPKRRGKSRRRTMRVVTRPAGHAVNLTGSLACPAAPPARYAARMHEGS